MSDEQLELPIMDERYFTPKEIAEKFGVRTSTVHNWTRSGRLRAIKVGKWTRIPESAIRELAHEMYGD